VARRDSKRRCEACGLPGADYLRTNAPVTSYTVPWNALLRARTHKGSSVYVCPNCKTPVERTRRSFKPTPAAAAAFNHSDHSILAIECPLTKTPVLTTHEGFIPGLCADGTLRLFEWPDAGLDEALATAYYAAGLLATEPLQSTSDPTVAKVRSATVQGFQERGGLPPPERAVKDWLVPDE
jgi:hypothetical protein